MVFVDLDIAYDSVSRVLLFEALKIGIGEPLKYFKIKIDRCRVKEGLALLKEFSTSKCPMSPTLFKIHIYVALKKW